MSAILRELEPHLAPVTFAATRIFSLWRRWEHEGPYFHLWYLVALSTETNMLLMAGLRGSAQWEVMHHEKGMDGFPNAPFVGFQPEPVGDGRVK